MSATTRAWACVALAGALYYAGARLGTLTVLPEGMAIVWPPNAVVLAALLRLGVRWLPAIGAVVTAAEVAADLPVFSLAEALLFALINLGEATLAFALLRRLVFDPRFPQLADAWKFLVAGPLAAAFAASLAGAAVYSVFRGGHAGYFELVRTWWFGDALGLLLLTPLLLAFPPFGEAPAVPMPRRRAGLADAALLAAAVLAVAVFWLSARFGTQMRPFIFLPLALVAAARYPQRWAALGAAAFSAVLVLGLARGLQPFGPLPPRDSVIQAQGFIFVLTLTTLGFAALLGQLRRHESELQERVAERTRELQQANERLVRLAVLDALTGVGNRRHFDQTLAALVERALRYREPLSLVLADLDHFKHINDSRGHAAGDEVLRETGLALRECARGADVVARVGGEEFAVILPHTSLEQARLFAERARRAVAGLPGGVTASFGVAQLAAQGDGAGLLAAADAALYRAKAAGRDRVEAAQPLGV